MIIIKLNYFDDRNTIFFLVKCFMECYICKEKTLLEDKKVVRRNYKSNRIRK